MSLRVRRVTTSESVKAIEESVQMVGGRVLIAGGDRVMVGGSLLIASGSADAPPVCTQNRVACTKSSSAHPLQRPVGTENCRGGALIAGGGALIVGGDYLSVRIYKLTTRSNAVIARSARLDDAKAIATIHVHAWQAAYKDILPSAFLESLSIEQRAATWRQILERRSSETWVAEDGGEILGWISAGKSRDEDALPTTGEVWAVYVSPSHWRRGVGRYLWHEAKEYLRTFSFSDVTLWVLKQNAQAIAFYESIGLAIEPGIEKTITLGGAELLEIRLRTRII